MKWKDILQLPKDVTDAGEIIRILADKELYLNNYEKIITCNSHEIRVHCKKRIVTMKGENLKIQYYNRDMMQVSGNFITIEFERGQCDK